MIDRNPYAAAGTAVAAADAAVEERALFLKRTYTWLMLGIVGWCATMWGVQKIPALTELSFAIARNWIVATILLMGGAWVVHRFADRRPLGGVLYGVYAFVFGLIVGPLVMLAGPELVSKAALVTGGVFVGLTAYVFVSGKDFSFLGGVLAILSVAILVALLAGWLLGFDFGLWMSVGIALLYCGFILFDTSRILHHMPTHMHVSAAAMLFANVVLLFYQILLLFLQRDD